MPLALLFDLDGTLLDTFDQLLEAQNGALAEFGYPPLPAEELRPLVGIPLARQMEVLRGMRGPSVEAINEAYYRRFVALVEEEVRLYPGVRATLATLSSRPIGTMTTRRQTVAELMLRVAGIRPYFRAVVGGDEVARPKPEPELPRFAARAIGAPPSECVVVGDAPVDILAGRAAGMWTVAATYGYGDLHELRNAGPHAAISEFRQLPEVLEELETSA
ncbi:MAG: HAD family hydrolase [Euryarchaeota archaeon]|nr:HAD family hydrolase [Euryarchaeota archaeon]